MVSSLPEGSWHTPSGGAGQKDSGVTGPKKKVALLKPDDRSTPRTGLWYVPYPRLLYH